MGLRGRHPWRLLGLAAIVAAALPAGVAASGPGGSTYAEPAVTAVFLARSYAPGETAHLAIRTAGAIDVQLWHAGPEGRRARSDDRMAGVPVAPTLHVRGARTVAIRIGSWPSGLYFARLHGPHGLLGFAPFVLRPRTYGRARVLEVLPTNTWAAYNFRDENGDGIGDTWYASAAIHTVDLDRPFLDRGVPPHYRAYDSGFVHWLAHSGHRADFVSDDDLERFASGRELAKLYDLIVFSGHEEYVTPHVYDLIEQYRNLGGNLLFLASNNFFYRVTRSGHVLHGRTRWRDVGRPEEQLIGAQYVDWNHDRYPNRPYVVVGAKRAPWLFRRAGLRNGDAFGTFGIEIDAQGPLSPPGTKVLATIRNTFGPGKSAEMTYYETRRGAKVFDAGVMNFGGSAQQPVVSKLLEALWERLAKP